MDNQEAVRLIRNLPTMCEFTDAYGGQIDSDAYYEAVDMAISALQAQERAESLYQMACERLDKKRETTPYELGRLSALSEVTGHVAQSFNPE